MPRLEAEPLLDEARRRTGLEELGEPAVHEPMRVLLDALNGEASLSFIGRLAAHADMIHLLTNRLRLVEDRRRRPEIAEQTIRRPLFILGLPRTGTTLLYGLLSQDPANRTPLSWEVMLPSPPPRRADYESDPRIARADRRMRWVYRLAPEFRHIHPISARRPQECIAIIAHTFASPRFYTMYHVPSYQRWVLDQDTRPAYAFHKRFLQHLQSGHAGARWVLKSPAHVFRLDALLETYPDACIVQTHRDPMAALASMASLTAVLRRPFTDRLDPRDIGAGISERWARTLHKVAEARAMHSGKWGQFIDVHYAELGRDPMAVVRRIYAAFDLPLTDEAAARMKRYLTDNPKDKHGRHRYSLAEFGLDPEVEGTRFRSYREYFDVAAQTIPIEWVS